MTDAEVILWSQLKGKQLHNTIFNRQKPIGPYVPDFYCHAAQLIIELDGSQHFETEAAQRKDQLRDAYFQSRGLHVLRFTNHEVFSNLPGVLDTIYDYLTKKIPLNPPFSKGETRHNFRWDL